MRSCSDHINCPRTAALRTVVFDQNSAEYSPDVAGQNVTKLGAQAGTIDHRVTSQLLASARIHPCSDTRLLLTSTCSARGDFQEQMLEHGGH
jgi:hypothetical protein